MSKRKWGESFLKSGLPLEHLAHVTLRSIGWDCSPRIEVLRPNKNGQCKAFELDLDASCNEFNRDTELTFLIECKYHDKSRYWMFLPHVPTGRWQFDDRVLNCGPFQPVKYPRKDTFLGLAPLSASGIVVSEDGTQQDNAIYAAIQQLTNAFVPLSLQHSFGYNIDITNLADGYDPEKFEPVSTAKIPIIVTNALIYRLRSDVTDLDLIREAVNPSDIAEEVPWTWCYNDGSIDILDQNQAAIDAHLYSHEEDIARFPGIQDRMFTFINRPNWIAVINIKHLSEVTNTIKEKFLELEIIRTRKLIYPTKKK